MYGLLWRSLPGRWPLRVLELLVLAAAAIALLMYVVFPWADPKLPFNDNTIDSPSSVVTPVPGGSSAPTSAAPTGSPTPTSTRSGQVLPGD